MDSDKKTLLTQELALWNEILRKLKSKMGIHLYMCCIIDDLSMGGYYPVSVCSAAKSKIKAHLDGLVKTGWRPSTYNNCLTRARRLRYPETPENFLPTRERLNFINYCRMKFCAFNIKQLRKEIAACQ